jgi:hypothetical protein
MDFWYLLAIGIWWSPVIFFVRMMVFGFENEERRHPVVKRPILIRRRTAVRGYIGKDHQVSEVPRRVGMDPSRCS